MQSNDLKNSSAVLTEGKIVMFLVLNGDYKYDYFPGYKRNDTYFYPDGYPMSKELTPIAWSELDTLPEGGKYTWES